MKEYNKPSIVDEIVEIEDIVATSPDDEPEEPITDIGGADE